MLGVKATRATFEPTRHQVLPGEKACCRYAHIEPPREAHCDIKLFAVALGLYHPSALRVFTNEGSEAARSVWIALAGLRADLNPSRYLRRAA